jgi:dipeptidyl aminopeptidase/acylaminoacyl peptidase
VDLWRVELAGERRPERIELAGRHTIHPATTASQDRLVFSQYDRDAHLYRFQAGRAIEPVAPSSSLETDPHFSRDGRRIAFASGRSGDVTIWVAADDGSDARQLTHGTWTWQGSPHWSPDGRTIAFDAFDPDGVHVWTINTEGGNPHRVTTHAGDQTVPTWSQDGKWIYFSEDRGGRRELWRIRASGGEPEQMTRTGSGFLGIESADGTGLLYQPTNADSPLHLLPINGGPSRQLVDCVRSSAFATAGPTVVYVACEPGSKPTLHALDTISGRDRLLGRLEKFEPDMPHVNLAVSPDGKTILYRGVTRKGGDLMMIEDFR